MLYLPFILQGIVMVIDEFIIHEKRGLPKWERYGHPLDSLTVLAALLSLQWNQNLYIALSVFSCLFITKDEFIHQKECSPFEHWLHAVLFILHPAIFFCAWLMWKEDPSHLFLKIQTIVIALFMAYQVLRWSLPWQKLTMAFTKPSAKDGTKPPMIRSHSFVRKIISSARG